jgi:hypothetical protein
MEGLSSKKRLGKKMKMKKANMKAAFQEWLQKKVDHEKAQKKFMGVYDEYKDELER